MIGDVEGAVYGVAVRGDGEAEVVGDVDSNDWEIGVDARDGGLAYVTGDIGLNYPGESYAGVQGSAGDVILTRIVSRGSVDSDNPIQVVVHSESAHFIDDGDVLIHSSATGRRIRAHDNAKAELFLCSLAGYTGTPLFVHQETGGAVSIKPDPAGVEGANILSGVEILGVAGTFDEAARNEDPQEENVKAGETYKIHNEDKGGHFGTADTKASYVGDMIS